MDKLRETIELIPSNFNSATIFKDLCEYFGELIISSLRNNTRNEKKPDFFLYFNQLYDCLHLYARIITEEEHKNIILKECRKSIRNRMVFCLDKVTETCETRKISPTRHLGCFMNWINKVLDSVKNIHSATDPLKEFKETELIFENILSNALWIAQICLNEDIKAIRGSCQSVLDSLESLRNHLNRHDVNKAMLQLFADNCGDKLCSLERKLDMAILRLTLEVFSKTSLNKLSESNSDEFIENFDLHCDRLMQIGLFATFCSWNKSGVNLLNSMANLEYLEQELVPSLLVALKKNSEISQSSAMIYKNCWEDEEIKFKKLLFEIIDVNAFSSMIREEISQRIDKIQETSKIQSIPKETFVEILNPALVLLDFMSIASKNEQFNDKIQDIVVKIRLVTCELSNAIEILDETPETYVRLLKRCKILKAEMKKLVLAQNIEYFNGGNDENLVDENYSELLDSLDRRGKSILKNRSILYRTRDEILEVSGAEDNYSMDSLEFPRIVLSFRSKIENLTTELNITEILEGLSELSTRS